MDFHNLHIEGNEDDDTHYSSQEVAPPRSSIMKKLLVKAVLYHPVPPETLQIFDHANLIKSHRSTVACNELLAKVIDHCLLVVQTASLSPSTWEK